MEAIKNYITICLALSCFLSSYAQDDVSNLEQKDEVKLVIKARVKKDKILLRWGPNEKSAWKYGNAYGYILERATIMRNGEPLQNAEKIILTGGPIKPRPISEWSEVVENNDMAAVAAQAIYGENFNTSDDNENRILQVINESSEQQQRFGFAMFAIDQSFEAAVLAGLGYIDDNVNENEKYLYNVKIAVPEDILQIKEVGLFIAPSEILKLPEPYDFTGYYYNDAFVLIWEYDALQNFYNSYDIEKSVDGINFSKVNQVPITKLASTEISGISFTDSITTYEKEYSYRIKGKTIFGEMSPPSNTISVIAYKKLLVAPELKENEIISDKEVIFKWEFAQDEAWKVTSFDIMRADKAIGPYDIIKEDLESKIRSFRYAKLEDINYFKIRAKGIAGDYQDSSPLMIQPIDSVPPSQPLGLTGTIDTLGVVKLSWEKNLELDLKGYTLLRANRLNQEFTRLNKQELDNTNYVDTISLKSFNEKVFYKLIAQDNRYNESLPSEVLILKRPDMISPLSPLFQGYEVTDNGISITWQNSGSEDVVRHIIYRKKQNIEQETLWENIYETNDTVTSNYLDETVESNTKYIYTIVAVDQGNLESLPSPPIAVTTTQKLLRPEIKGLYANVDRENHFIELSWRYKELDIVEIQLFRKIGLESEFTLYETFTPQRKKFIDTSLVPNTIYAYGLKAIFNDGSISEWNEIDVKY